MSVVTRFTLAPTNLPNTGFGDLPLSTAGWHPFGPAPYGQDTAATGRTRWNFVVLTGTGDIYEGAALANSDALTQDAAYRHDQFVGYGGGQRKPEIAAVSVDPRALPNIFDGTVDAIGGQLMYSIPLSALDLLPGSSTGLALCCLTRANDIIEASAAVDNAVPKPGTVSLILGGLVGWRMGHSRRGAGKGWHGLLPGRF